MIDLKKFREDPQIYIQGVAKKRVDVDFEKFQMLDARLRELKSQIEELQHKRNEFSQQIQENQKSGDDFADKINQVKSIKKQIETLSSEMETVENQFNEILYKIPNPPLDDVPTGEDDSQNVEQIKVGDIPTFDFKPLPHWELLEKRGMLDTERSAKTSGSRFFFIRDGLVKLELALIQYALNKLEQKGFRLTIGPNMVKEDAMYCTGYFPADQSQIYNVNPDDDNLHMIGTSEVILVSQHMGEILESDVLPLRYAGFSPCYRREAGSYGKDTRGLIRVHQFEKVEMVSFVRPQDGEKEHQFILGIEEEIYQDLNIPYRRLLICSGDLGAPAAKKYDLEAWFPGLDDYKEITSCSNTTDFQARRGKIKFRDGKNKDFVYTLNGTAIAIGRTMVAIVENYQQKDGMIAVPEVLKPYINQELI